MRNKSELTDEQAWQRRERSVARRQMAEAEYLQARYDLARGQGRDWNKDKGKGWRKGGKGCAGRRIEPLRWDQMTAEQQQLLWMKWREVPFVMLCRLMIVLNPLDSQLKG